MTRTSRHRKRSPGCRPRLEALEDRSLLSAGALDLTFGSNGKVTTDLGGPDEGTGLALQPDGKIVVAGIALDGAGEGNFAVARYLADGSPDPGFGSGGKVVTDFFG